MTSFLRAFPLEDIQVRSGGDGRTVEAYAAVFDTSVEITDFEGRYLEAIDPHAFDRTIAHKGTRFGVFYNHGATIHGTPSDRGSIPLGTPIEVVADAKGVRTVSRYNKTPLADEILESIRNGDIQGQSFSGRFVRSDKPTPRGGFRAGKDGALTTVRRMEIAMREYGPTPFPAYADAVVVGVRSLAEQLVGLSDEERAEIIRMAQQATRLDGDDPARDDSATSSQQEPGTEASPEDGHAARLKQFHHDRAEARKEGGPLS